MSDIKQHEINKRNDLFIKGYYAPDEVINPLVEWCRTLPLEGGSSMNSATGKIDRWDGKKNSHKECYEHGIFWPTLREPSILNFLDLSNFL